MVEVAVDTPLPFLIGFTLVPNHSRMASGAMGNHPLYRQESFHGSVVVVGIGFGLFPAAHLNFSLTR